MSSLDEMQPEGHSTNEAPNRIAASDSGGGGSLASFPPHTPDDGRATLQEEALEPDLPIIDPHHHLWERKGPNAFGSGESTDAFIALMDRFPTFLLDQLLASFGGHAIKATVFAECGSMYRADGPPEMMTLGETEFVNGIAAVSASGNHGPARIAAGIIAAVDLSQGAAAGRVLDAHQRAAGDRLKGVRLSNCGDSDPEVLGLLSQFIDRHLFDNPVLVEGLKELQARSLVLDVWTLEPQLPELTALARKVPDLPIIIDHCGTPVGMGRYAGQHAERFAIWQESIRELAALPNTIMKVGGLGMPWSALPSYLVNASSATLAQEWRPYVETCIEAFGADRCMFESNYPSEGGTATYSVIWNTFKRLASGASEQEKSALFSGTAVRVYGLSDSYLD